MYASWKVTYLRLQIQKNDKGLTRRLIDVFLPDGYPNCVSDDYASYQIYVGHLYYSDQPDRF